MHNFFKTLCAFLILSLCTFQVQGHAKPRIVHVVTYLKIGGVEAQLYDLLKHFKSVDKTEHHVIYFAHGPDVMLEKIRSLGVQTHHVKGLWSEPKPDPLLYYRFKRLIKKLKPDLLHSGLLTADVVSRYAGKEFHIPVVCDIHGDCLNLYKPKNVLDAETVHLADRIVSTSETAKKSFEMEILPRIKNQRKRAHVIQNLSVIPNGIHVEKTRASQMQELPLTRQELGIHENDFVVGYVGSLITAKRINDLIKAFAKLCERVQKSEGQCFLKLCLVGDGNQMKKLKKFARKCNVADKVLFMGYRTDRHRFYPVFNCFVLPSLCDTLSVALLDAMCFKLPVVTATRWGFHDVIEHDKNGILVPMYNVDGLTDALQKLYENKALAQQMGNLNEKLVEERCSFSRKAEQYEKLFDEVLQSGKRAY